MKDNVTKIGKFGNLTNCNILKNDILGPLLQLLKESSIFNALNKTIPSSKDIEWYCFIAIAPVYDISNSTYGISGFNIEKWVG